jgi:hypothetical protein
MIVPETINAAPIKVFVSIGSFKIKNARPSAMATLNLSIGAYLGQECRSSREKRR